MSPRVGTLAALVASSLLAISIATSWWSGSPSLDGKVFNRKTAHIGLVTGTQCNYDDDAQEESDCKHLAIGGTLGILKFVQLGFTGVLGLCLIGVALAKDKRRGFAKLVMITVAASAVMSVVLLLIGPDLKTGHSESMPIGIPFIFSFFGGTAIAIASGVISLLPPRTAKAPGWATLPSPSAPHVQPAFDVEALLAQDTLRPAALGPEPMLGKAQSPGGMLPGPAGPLVPQSRPQPLFSSAPQLRPLYETTTGSGGFAPPPPVQFPTRGPTPLAHAAVSALTGFDAPPPPQPPKLPPSRTKPLSVAPPLISARPLPAIPPRAPTKLPPIARAHATQISAAVPPPSRPSDPNDMLETDAFEKQKLGTDDTAMATPFSHDSTSETTGAFAEENTNTDGTGVETDAHERLSVTEVELASRASTELLKVPPRKSAPQNIAISTAPESLPPPAETAASGGPAPACPQCESPMAWVEEHLRFYCKSCRMYF